MSQSLDDPDFKTDLPESPDIAAAYIRADIREIEKILVGARYGLTGPFHRLSEISSGECCDPGYVDDTILMLESFSQRCWLDVTKVTWNVSLQELFLTIAKGVDQLITILKRRAFEDIWGTQEQVEKAMEETLVFR